MKQLKTAVLLGILALVSAEAVAQDAWWDPAWTKRRELILDNSGQGSNLANFFTSPDATGLAVHSGAVVERIDNGAF